MGGLRCGPFEVGVGFEIEWAGLVLSFSWAISRPMVHLELIRTLSVSWRACVFFLLGPVRSQWVIIFGLHRDGLNLQQIRNSSKRVITLFLGRPNFLLHALS